MLKEEIKNIKVVHTYIDGKQVIKNTFYEENWENLFAIDSSHD